MVNGFYVKSKPIVIIQAMTSGPTLQSVPLPGALTALIPVSLYNFQAAIEYPFDQKGSDDIKLEHYRFRP
jgi:hypothetical protein